MLIAFRRLPACMTVPGTAVRPGVEPTCELPARLRQPLRALPPTARAAPEVAPGGGRCRAGAAGR
eukprot:CAMPEP_0175645036 /NCGR_PEP_ID=MMETSP0097-20121207/6613_1 /TAXON_ID=311494 /ORGANISM="Alexandrium monilatum, Strain CCMP3105" /LENGTH=64 /DNA_ID=CAMNT_0016950919 /DNA_START=1 /DNA_END=191 /DNA_ORIENTATION=-